MNAQWKAPWSWEEQQAERFEAEGDTSAAEDSRTAANQTRADHVSEQANRIPSRFREATSEETLGDRGPFLWGAVGAGKTHLAAALALQAAAQGARVEWVSVPAWLQYRRPSDDGRQAAASGDELAACCDVLVLDDLGSEKPSEWVREQLFLLVNRAYEDDKLVIVTSNDRLSQLSGRIGERTASRLGELCELREVTGPDRRLQTALHRKTAQTTDRKD